TIPAYQSGPRYELLERMENHEFFTPIQNDFLTHGLHEPENDPILNRIKQNKLTNSPDDAVQVIFVPAYLNGSDGIFNLSYYELLIGFDGTVFPSYYEPWGYTPLESLAFHIPSITTSLAGFGLWIKSLFPGLKDCTTVISRGDDNESFVVDEIVKTLFSCSRKSETEMMDSRHLAYEISRSALWKNLISQYHQAYTVALGKTSLRLELYAGKSPVLKTAGMKSFAEAKPEWKKVLIQPSIPQNLEGMVRLSKNLWWAWNHEGGDLFSLVDPARWQQMGHNPVALIESLSFQELQRLSSNISFIDKLNEVVGKFDAYMDKASEKMKATVAYFSMEFGLHDTIKIFSGGLGMLAGDYLKQASDSNVDIIGIGLLYRYGYFQQRITISGDQVAKTIPQKFTHLPLVPLRDEEGNWMKITFGLPGRMMYAKVWRVDVGRVPLYLLDTDIEENLESDRVITHQLYGGDNENRLRQEILLGIGGIRMLNQLGIKPDLYHSNEGHSAFLGIERLRDLVEEEHLTFPQAVEMVRSSTLFTTHTPVPAGHDTFSEDLVRQYLSHYADHLNIKWEQFLHLGRINENDPDEKFSMSILASKLSQEINAVSRIHGRVTREMFRDLYPGYYPSELHIGYVTNGVHYPTWTARSWQELYKNQFGEGFFDDQSNPEYWKKIHEVDDKIVWETRLKEKEVLNKYLMERLYGDMTRRNENPKLIFQIKEAAHPKALTIGFARRFATYKRAHLLFSNLDRLAKIVNNSS
ncbi:MAG: alpha-glucan family phosphorylase, partial [Bacteroidota bacterium]